MNHFDYYLLVVSVDVIVVLVDVGVIVVVVDVVGGSSFKKII
jgi:hypothetical protein